MKKDDYDHIRTTSPRFPVLFYNRKIHKKGMPLCPIIFAIDSYNYKLAKFLTKLSEKARTKLTSYLKDSVSVAKLINNKKPEETT